MMRSTSLRSNNCTAWATASQVLPGARRPGAEDQRVAAQRADIGVLRRGARAYGTLAQVDLLESRPRGRRVVVEQRALRDRQADRPFDVAGNQLVAALELLVEPFEHPPRSLHPVPPPRPPAPIPP